MCFGSDGPSRALTAQTSLSIRSLTEAVTDRLMKERREGNAELRKLSQQHTSVAGAPGQDRVTTTKHR